MTSNGNSNLANIVASALAQQETAEGEEGGEPLGRWQKYVKNAGLGNLMGQFSIPWDSHPIQWDGIGIGQSCLNSLSHEQ